jgi:methyl-accepting chemotaxis protein
MHKITLDSVGLLSEALQDLRKFSEEAKMMMDSFDATLRASEGQNRQALKIAQNLQALSDTSASAAQELSRSLQEYKEHWEKILNSITEQVEGLQSAADAVKALPKDSPALTNPWPTVSRLCRGNEPV